MKVKVCGLNNPFNIKELNNIGVDMYGFIFYKKSIRYFNNALNTEVLRELKASIEKVGVFVNPSEYELMDRLAEYHLNYIQLHGNESVEMCGKFRPYVKIIKVFSIEDTIDTKKMKPYLNVVDYFLFDTKSKLHGGSGKKFDWRVLDEYDLNKPFFLSGGITLEDAETIRHLDYKYLYGVDINSKFEIVPGTKDINQVKQFIQEIKN